MWCIGELTEEYRNRMYALLELYARPLSAAEPVSASTRRACNSLATAASRCP